MSESTLLVRREIEDDMQRQNNFPMQGANSKAQVLKITGRIPLGPNTFLLLSSNGAEITLSKEISKLRLNDQKKEEGERITPESSKVKARGFN